MKGRAVVALSLLIFASLPIPAGAATTAVTRPTAPLDLSTSPLPITLAAKPGQTVTADLKVKQAGGNTEKLQVHLMKFSAYGVDGKPALSERGPGDDYFDWVSFDKPVFTAPNDVWQTVKMTIKLPASAAFEYNYAVEFTRVGDNLSPGGNIEGIAGGTAVLILLNADVPGEHRSVQLQSFGVEHRVVEFLPTTFNVNLFNDGNVYVQPTGDIFVTQYGHQVGTILINDEQGNILAGTHRVYSTVWADGFPYYEPKKDSKGKYVMDKHGVMQTDLNWNLPTNAKAASDNTTASTTNFTMEKESTNPLSRLRFGSYTARLVVVYQDGFGRDVPITSEMSFWVIPWRLLLALLIILLAFGFAGYSLVRNVMRRNQRMQRLKRKKS